LRVFNGEGSEELFAADDDPTCSYGELMSTIQNVRMRAHRSYLVVVESYNSAVQGTFELTLDGISESAGITPPPTSAGITPQPTTMGGSLECAFYPDGRSWESEYGSCSDYNQDICDSTGLYTDCNYDYCDIDWDGIYFAYEACSECGICGQEVPECSEGDQWEGEDCTTCFCINGDALCSPVDCAVPPCENFVLEEGACCPSCQPDECAPGETWQEDDCTFCECFNGEAICYGVDCFISPSCISLIFTEGECCPTCETYAPSVQPTPHPTEIPSMTPTTVPSAQPLQTCFECGHDDAGVYSCLPSPTVCAEGTTNCVKYVQNLEDELIIQQGCDDQTVVDNNVVKSRMCDEYSNAVGEGCRFSTGAIICSSSNFGPSFEVDILADFEAVSEECNLVAALRSMLSLVGVTAEEFERDKAMQRALRNDLALAAGDIAVERVSILGVFEEPPNDDTRRLQEERCNVEYQIMFPTAAIAEETVSMLRSVEFQNFKEYTIQQGYGMSEAFTSSDIEIVTSPTMENDPGPSDDPGSYEPPCCGSTQNYTHVGVAAAGALTVLGILFLIYRKANCTGEVKDNEPRLRVEAQQPKTKLEQAVQNYSPGNMGTEIAEQVVI